MVCLQIVFFFFNKSCGNTENSLPFCRNLPNRSTGHSGFCCQQIDNQVDNLINGSIGNVINLTVDYMINRCHSTETS